MHHAQPYLRFREYRFDGFRETFQPIHAHDEDICQTAILHLGEHLQPELGAFGLACPQPQHHLCALHIHPNARERVIPPEQFQCC